MFVHKLVIVQIYTNYRCILVRNVTNYVYFNNKFGNNSKITLFNRKKSQKQTSYVYKRGINYGIKTKRLESSVKLFEQSNSRCICGKYHVNTHFSTVNQPGKYPIQHCSQISTILTIIRTKGSESPEGESQKGVLTCFD